MLVVVLFWSATLTLIIIAAGFIVPPLLLANSANISSTQRYVYSGLLVLFLLGASYGLYTQFGALPELKRYYATTSEQERASYKLIRPLYTRIAHELVKDQLDLQLDLNNVDLILNFAQIHSQAQGGVLQPEIQQLLLAVLKTLPQQVTALNLLAIHAYKSTDFPLAIQYWQKILQQFPPELANSNLKQILEHKIAATTKLMQQNSQGS